MQKLRSDGCDNFLEKVTSFCDKHGVEVPTMDGDYVSYENQQEKLVPKSKPKMTTLEEKYILVSLIK